MIFLKALIQLLTLLCLIQLNYVNAKLELVKKSHVFPGKYVRYNNNAIGKGILVFAVCDGQGDEKNCTIVQQKYPYDEITRSCNLTINTSENRNNIFVDVSPLTNDRILLIWNEEGKYSNITYIKFLTLRMSDCKSSEIQFLDSFDHTIYLQQCHGQFIVRYNNSYEVFLRNQNLSIKDIRHIRVNYQTGSMEEIDSTIKKSEEFYTVQSVDAETPAKGYIYFEYDSKCKVWLAKAGVPTKLLATYKYCDHNIVSSMHNTIGTCGRLSFEFSDLLCSLYDENGNVLSRTMINLPKIGFEDRMPISMHISANGGFLLMFAKYVSADWPSEEWSGYHVVKVDAEGKVISSLRLKEFDNLIVDYIMIARIYEKDIGEYCTTLMGWDHRLPKDIYLLQSHLDITGYCFTEADFKSFF